MSSPDYTTKDVNRFWSKVDKSGGQDSCWEYTAYIAKTGYGQFWLNGKNLLSHRVAYLFTHGTIPDGLCVCHSCDNRKCCNSAHLWLGTYYDNLHDMRVKGRAPNQYGERNPYCKLTDEQVEAIRQRYIPRVITQQMLADEYNVTRANIGYIVRNKSRKR